MLPYFYLSKQFFYGRILDSILRCNYPFCFGYYLTLDIS